MIGQYLPLVLLFGLAVVFAVGSFLTTGLLAPKRSNDRKSAPYQCGIIPSKETPERFPVRFFLVAMIFIVFDIEIIFFYPWAVTHEEVGVRSRRGAHLHVRGVRVVRVPDLERRARVGPGPSHA